MWRGPCRSRGLLAEASPADYRRDPSRWGSPEVAALFPGFKHLDMRTNGATHAIDVPEVLDSQTRSPSTRTVFDSAPTVSDTSICQVGRPSDDHALPISTTSVPGLPRQTSDGARILPAPEMLPAVQTDAGMQLRKLTEEDAVMSDE